MNSVVVFLGLLALAAATPFHFKEKVIDENIDWRIVGGSDASAGQFPYIISLRGSSGSHSCGGSIISESKILTAAHCVDGASASSLTVVAGSHLLNSGGSSHRVSSLVIHPEWDSWDLVNDVAVLTLTTPISIGDNTAIIPLETTNVGVVDCVLCGWGTTTYPGSIPNNLQWINLQTVSVSDCQTAHGSNPVFDSQVCTFTRSGEGACHGDSGGPLASAGNQIGIVSWGMPCGIGYPDVFTRVSSFASWINSQ